MKIRSLPLASLLAGSLLSTAHASDREELLTLKNTTLNLIQLLVEQGVLDPKKAKAMIAAAEQKAAAEAKQQLQAEAAAGEEGESKAAKTAKSAAVDKSVRVAYVPDFIKEEIRQQVRSELKDDVVKEVKAHAREEKWGIPAALPDWVNRFKLSGDVRLRGEWDYFADQNPRNGQLLGHDFSPLSYANWLAVNNGASLLDFRTSSPAYLNTSEDVQRFRLRLRLGLDAQITDGLKAGVRLATSNSRSPVSTNQTLGQTGQQYEFALDRAFLQYDYVDDKGKDWFSVWAGRTLNPWLSTDNVFDSDLSFEGISATLRVPLPGGNPKYVPPLPNARYGTNMGFSRPNSLFLTGGIYPLEEFQITSKDKWLWGSQVGADLLFQDVSRLKLGVAYYDYHNVKGQPNTPELAGGDRADRNFTAPQFLQKGNTLLQINTDGSGAAVIPTRVGLASGFQIVNAVASYDYTGFGDTHVILTADYSKNFGFDARDIARRASRSSYGIVNYADGLRERTSAWQVRLDLGTPQIVKRSDWNLMFAYKYLERDAVFDAFTDSDFHLGGTNAKGWVFGASYGITTNTWLNARWMTADPIDGPKYAIDTLFVDLNSRF